MATDWPPVSDGRGAWTDTPAASIPPASYARAVRSHLLLVAVVAAATVAGAVAWHLSSSASYQANAELLVTPLPAEDLAFLHVPLVRDGGDATRTIQTAAALADSRQAAELTARRLGGEWSASRVAAAVDVDPRGQTNILTVIATAPSAAEAAAIANAFADSVISVRNQTTRVSAERAIPIVRERLRTLPRTSPAAVDLERTLTRLETIQQDGDPTVAIAERATEPGSPVGEPLALLFAIALIAGVALGIGVALVRELLGPRLLSSEEELLTVLPLPVLARVSRIRHSSLAGDVDGMDPAALAALRDVRAQLELTSKRPRNVLFTAASSSNEQESVGAAFALALALDGYDVRLLTAEGSAARLADIARAGSENGGAKRRPVSRPVASAKAAPNRLEVRELRAEPGAASRSGSKKDSPLFSSSADYNVVDAAPLGEVADALPYVRLVDDTVIVVSLRTVTVAQVERLRALFSRAGTVPTGYILVDGRSAR